MDPGTESGVSYGISAKGYRYGFNGKENDNEVKGEDNQIDFGARIYNPGLRKFLSVDPMKKDFPEELPYDFAGNAPTVVIDYNVLFKISPIRKIERNIKKIIQCYNKYFDIC